MFSRHKHGIKKGKKKKMDQEALTRCEWFDISGLCASYSSLYSVSPSMYDKNSAGPQAELEKKKI